MGRWSIVFAVLLGCEPVKVLPEGDSDGGGEEVIGETAAPDDTQDTASSTPCPGLSAAQLPSPAQLTGLLDPIVILTDADDGTLLTAVAGEGSVAIGGTLTAEVVSGEARLEAVEALEPGLLSIDVAIEGCAPALTVGPLVVGEGMRSEPVFLPGARVGSEYAEITTWEAVDQAALPDGLRFSDGWLTGAPEREGAWGFEAAAREGEDVVRYTAQLAVFPSDDHLEDAPSEPSEPGAYDAGSLDLSVPTVTTSRGTSRDVAVRVAFPADAEGSAAEGPFPLIVFHHAAHSPSQIYDDYTALHDHWASHGYVVASVDGAELVSASQSWQNLTDMSTFQLAAMDLLLDAHEDPGNPLYGRLDPDRIFVAGHSRGGGASLISLWREPALMGALCFAQVSPLQTPSQDWDDPEGNGDRAFPTRPILFLAAGDDLDEPWPLPHSAYDQTSGPTVFVVEHGTNHEWTYDEGTPGSVTSPSDISWEERHALDQAYSTAFLERFARSDLSWESALFAAPALSSTLSDRGVSVIGRRNLDTELSVDDFSGSAVENLLGGANEGEGLSADENAAPYTDGLEAAGRGREQIDRIDAWTGARRLGWDSEDATLRFLLTPDGEGLDLGDHRALSLRLSAPCDPPPGDCDAVSPDVSIVLIDAAGGEQTVDLADSMGALGVVGRHWGQAIVPLDDFLPVDLSRVVALELRFLAAIAPDDALWLDDPRFE